jgi:hypothetical protein
MSDVPTLQNDGCLLCDTVWEITELLKADLGGEMQQLQ